MNKISKALLVLITIIIIIIIIFSVVNKREKDWHHYINTTHKYVDTPSSHDIVVYRRPGSTDEEFNIWISDITKKYGEDLQIVKFCGSCDSSILVLVGSAPDSFITKQGVVQGGVNPAAPPGGPQDTGPIDKQGVGGNIFYSSNYSVDSKDTIHDKCNDSLRRSFIQQEYFLYRQSGKGRPDSGRQNTNGCSLPLNKTIFATKDSITVAVFDTGIDSTSISGYMFKSSKPACLDSVGKNAKNGWNFINKDATWYNDDFEGQHGTIVSRLIVQDVILANNNPVKILPVKLLSSTGRCTLFDLLCAFSYAKDRGAKIINASLGYYAPVAKNKEHIDSCATLLKAFIEETLTKNNILLVCAAGNNTNLSTTHSLNDTAFYPASLSKSLQNIFAVTTIDSSTNKVSSVQNYSAKVVDVGVLGKTGTDGNGSRNDLFSNPLVSGADVLGSSFAAPRFTALLCAYYDPNMFNSKSKNKIINFLKTKSSLLATNPLLADTTTFGNLMLRCQIP